MLCLFSYCFYGFVFYTWAPRVPAFDWLKVISLHVTLCHSVVSGPLRSFVSPRHVPGAREVMISHQGVGSVTTSEKKFSVFIGQITFSNQAYWKSPRRVWDYKIPSSVFFGAKFCFFWPKMRIDKSHKGIFFWVLPHFAKGPLRFFWRCDDEDNV
jgi:hypothetical protein